MSNLIQRKRSWEIVLSKKCSGLKRLLFEINDRKMEFLREIWCYMHEIDQKNRYIWKNLGFNFSLALSLRNTPYGVLVVSPKQ